jgi:chromosome partitioning protein
MPAEAPPREGGAEPPAPEGGAESAGAERYPALEQFVAGEILAPERPAEAEMEEESAEVGPRARIIAIANQKGGVGKSTTAVNLGACLAEAGQRVLVVDLDPQGNASTGLGIQHRERVVTTYDVITAGAAVETAIVETGMDRLHAIPSTIDLAGAEIELVSQFSRENRLRRALEAVSDRYDFILLDCPPSLGLLTVNALAAAEELVVPIQCEYYALEGLGQLLKNVRLVQQNVNPGLRLSGIVMTMFDVRTKLSDQVVSEVRSYFGPRVYEAVIPRSVRLSEAPGYGQPITRYDSGSKGAAAYRRLASEVMRKRGDEGVIGARRSAEEEQQAAVGTVGAAGGEEEAARDEGIGGLGGVGRENVIRGAVGTGPADEGSGEDADVGDEDRVRSPRRWPFRESEGGRT